MAGPAGRASYFKRLSAKALSLSTHPSPEDRIKDLRSYAEKLTPAYQGNPSAEE